MSGSDIACPFCYIGTSQLERAVRSVDVPVSVEYHSFELAPETPDVVPETHAQHLVDRMGVSPDHARQLEARTITVVTAAGLPIDYGILKKSNTRRAHRLLHLAKRYGLQSVMKQRLMRGYFAEGRSMASLADLTDLAAEVGLDRDAVNRSIDTVAYDDEVEADVRLAASSGITGVPFFVFDGRYAVSGAQDAETFVQVIKRTAEETPA